MDRHATTTAGLSRRFLLAAGLGAGALAAGSKADARSAEAAKVGRSASSSRATEFLAADPARDQSMALQAAIDAAARDDRPLHLPAGTFLVSDVRLRSGTRLIGAGGATVLRYAGGAAFITADRADGLVLRDIVFDGGFQQIDEARAEALIAINSARNIALSGIAIRASARGGLSLNGCSGRITEISVSDVLDFGIKSLDATGLDISQSTVGNCGNNGILIWRSDKGEDGTTVTGNRISGIRNSAGGTGEYGNGVNVFRAGGVIVANNRISDCTYTAVRGNAADNIQIVANNCERLGEVALYSEFGFQGAVIANNIVDTAACGISVTNFNEGGRLAVIQGNLIRNLFRRLNEPVDKRGEGIGVEADASITGNTIEGAPAAGIQIGWGDYMRDVAVTGNVIRQSGVGISVSGTDGAGTCLVANNLIAKSGNGAIRRSLLGTLSGPDYARTPSDDPRLSVSGNVAV